MLVFQEIAEAVICGNAKKVKEYAERALEDGALPQSIVNEGLIAGMNVVGMKFKNNEVYVPEVLISARAMHAGMDVVKPLLSASELQDKGTVLIGTVKGDLHDIGKNLVRMMLEGAGYRVIDLGVDVAPEKFVQVVQEQKPQVVGLSALLTTTMVNMRSTIERLKSYPVKVMIGGAPVTQKFADEIGADAYAPDAASAVEKAGQLLAS
ncbi:Cobalamin (vitamin B12)-binding domain protein [Acididesulfobacillus acetoxydans]|uniref:Cobalamin (Vitamin B12)-binding domain protein n=1 Tax=Acididesulfobacillus acetoxydans TaxID=1561005 RepID=A0A8S0X530_9FIRM|nr:corrinoid protein [Acididesulfobacillus acetoxydans]CAA7601310.1 Cobalamin (vitamin B12)-binding domain protein [Acididesulfobacillus acetoxydans]CEJ08780.1 Dimethylamine corrinoid protein 3 [Acididesulfobacillus acetoxydans]